MDIPVSAFYAESILTEGSENTELPGQGPESNKCTPQWEQLTRRRYTPRTRIAPGSRGGASRR